MVFHALTFARSRGNVNALKTTMFDRYYCIKTENICYISRYFLHYFDFIDVSRTQFLKNYARSRARHYTSRDGNNSVALVQAYLTLRSRAFTACELPC